MEKIYFVRHGETDWNRDRRIQGQSDLPLNDVGRDQAHTLAVTLASIHFDAAFSSDLSRALETAEIVLQGREIPIQLQIGLRERNFGKWEGRLADEIEVAGFLAGTGWPYVDAPPGGESVADLDRRVVETVSAIGAAHPEQTILMVAHGGVIRSALYAWVGVDAPIIANCGVYVIGVEDSTPRLLEQVGESLLL
jgi:broad specificity phosphatase PhoE